MKPGAEYLAGFATGWVAFMLLWMLSGFPIGQTVMKSVARIAPERCNPGNYFVIDWAGKPSCVREITDFSKGD